MADDDPRRAALDLLLANNFDKVSTLAVVTISKYVANIVGDPSEPKYRTINTANKAFQDKVKPATGSLELMHSIGFEPAAVSTSSDATSLHSSASAQFMMETMQLLHEAMERLQIPAEERPRPVQKVAASSSSSSAGPVPDFDPFRTSIVRTAPQPYRGGVSSTEAALEQLVRTQRPWLCPSVIPTFTPRALSRSLPLSPSLSLPSLPLSLSLSLPSVSPSLCP